MYGLCAYHHSPDTLLGSRNYAHLPWHGACIYRMCELCASRHNLGTFVRSLDCACFCAVAHSGGHDELAVVMACSVWCRSYRLPLMYLAVACHSLTFDAVAGLLLDRSAGTSQRLILDAVAGLLLEQDYRHCHSMLVVRCQLAVQAAVTVWSAVHVFS